MARQVDSQTVEEIVQAVGEHPEGATIEQVAAHVEVPRRTLQRRLAELVTSARVRAIGRGKQRRYQLVALAETHPDELSVSPAGRQVRSLVRQPLIKRTPIGYVASFLDGSLATACA